MLSTTKHSYACSMLFEKGIKIFNSGKQILYQVYQEKHPELKSYLRIGHNYAGEFMEKKIIKIDKDYGRLKQLGWKISSRYAPGFYFDYQRTEYFLTPLESVEQDYGGIPKDHFVLVDFPNQKIRFNGKNVSENDWMPLNPKKRERTIKKEINPFQLDRIQFGWEQEFEKNLPEFLKNQKEEVMQIQEAIVGITENGEICCLEPSDIAPRINIAGMSGMGKSQLKNNIQGQLYYKPVHNCNIFEINDVKYDTQTYCLAWDKNHPYYKELQIFYEPTIPLPYIYLHPAIKGLKEEQVLYKDEVGFEISFPFKDFLLEPSLLEYNKQWRTTPASRKFIKDLIEDNQGNTKIDGLLYKKNLDDIQNLIDISIEPEEKNSKLRNFIFTLIKDIWSRKILDINTGISSKWIAKVSDREYAYPPWDICLLFGLIPSFVTAYARNHDWFGIYMKYILEDVFKFAKTKDYRLLQRKKLILSGEELVKVLRNPQSRAIIDQVISEGRTDEIGFISVVQFYSDVPDSIITNLTHHFIFNSKSPKAMEDLKNSFPNLTHSQKKDIANLKEFQCYAFGDFILYDNKGNKYSNNGEPVKIIRIKRPNAQHYWKHYEVA